MSDLIFDTISKNWLVLALGTCGVLAIHGLVLFIKAIDPEVIVAVSAFGLVGYCFFRFLLPGMIRFILVANGRDYDSISTFVNAGLVFFSLGFVGYSIFELFVFPFLGEISGQTYFCVVPVAFGAVDGLFNARRKNESL